MANAGNTETAYGWTAKAFHWMVVALVVIMLAIGLSMDELPEGSFARFQALQWHKSVGITLLLVTLARLGWRLSQPQPAPLPSLQRWEVKLARLVQRSLLGLTILVPLAGWATVSASPLNLPIRLYGVIPWPHLPFIADVGDRKAAEEMFGEIHEVLIFTMVALIALHIAAALRHHFVQKDDTLRRMLPVAGTGPASGED